MIGSTSSTEGRPALSEVARKRALAGGPLAFHLLVQRSRLGVIALVATLAALARATGLVDFDLRWALLGIAVGVASVFGFMALYRVAAHRGWQAPIHYGWMALDILLICWSIWLIDDRSPLWLIWFLTNATAAAFVAGRRVADVVVAASCVAYLALLVAMGRIQGFDEQLAFAAGRLALLFGGSFFMARGIADLREKRREISALYQEKSARLVEMQRLAAELDLRGHELTEANRRILEANRTKSQFLANMSHELRTPLNSIIGFSEILSERLAGHVEPRFAKFLANIESSGRHLLDLINDILDLSKIEAGRMELGFESVSVGDVVHGVASVMHGVAARSDIGIDVEIAAELPILVADPPRLKQILYNLVSNAVKFSPQGSRVVIRARPVAAEDSPLALASVALEVQDQGIGIRREDQRLIFEEFRQVDGETTRNMGGTGLGLALVKRFTEMHGGRVEVDSEPGRGSRFRVLLPVDAARAPARSRPGDPVSFGFRITEASAALAAERPLLLVADDDDERFRTLAADLEAGGYRVARALDGDQATRLARVEAPAAIVLDLRLSGVDGFQTAAELGRDPATATIPLLVFTARETSTEDRRRLCGHVGALVSEAPGDRRGLLAMIDNLHQRRRQEAPRP